ncbi:MAG: hypothetical protein IPN86_24780 [Saprospiraceae bacterium]|nr:hypothetical protein [Saprospiraceae bacterium]
MYKYYGKAIATPRRRRSLRRTGNSYFPFQTFNDGGSIFLVFVTECEKIQIKEFIHVNSIVSTLTNKHGGPVVDVRSLYSNFIFEMKLQVTSEGNFNKIQSQLDANTIEVTINCPPTEVLDVIKLNEAINGATYIEFFTIKV